MHLIIFFTYFGWLGVTLVQGNPPKMIDFKMKIEASEVSLLGLPASLRDPFHIYIVYELI